MHTIYNKDYIYLAGHEEHLQSAHSQSVQVHGLHVHDISFFLATTTDGICNAPKRPKANNKVDNFIEHSLKRFTETYPYHFTMFQNWSQ